MDEFHEAVGRLGGIIHSQGDKIVRGANFIGEGTQYKGYLIQRDGAKIQALISSDGGYLNFEYHYALDGHIRQNRSEKELRRDLDAISSDATVQELIEIYLKKRLYEYDSEDGKSLREHVVRRIDDPQLRIDWRTVGEETVYLSGFTAFARTFPYDEPLTMRAYDNAINRVIHYGQTAVEVFVDEFESEFEQTDVNEQPEQEEPEQSLGRAYH